jgi:PmbA protein
LLKELRSKCCDFIFSNKINLSQEFIQLTNSENLNLSYKDKALKIELGVKHKDSINIMDFSIDITGRKYNRGELLNYIEEICRAYNNEVELPKQGKIPVVFLESEYLLYLKLWQELNGMKFGTGASLLSKAMGEKKFSEEFTLYQSATNKDVLVPFFDAEGVVNEDYKMPLIENGVIKSPYTNKKTAKTYKLPLTGAASSSYDEVPNLGIPSLAIKPANKSCKELLNGEMAVLVLVAAGGDYTAEGVFGTPVQMAMLFDGEKIIGRLPELQISSNLFSMYGEDFRGVSKDTINELSNSKHVVMDLQVNKL